MVRNFASAFWGLVAMAFANGMTSQVCLAHPDHPVQVGSGDSVAHYILQPEHSLPAVVLALALGCACRMLTKYRTNRELAYLHSAEETHQD